LRLGSKNGGILNTKFIIADIIVRVAVSVVENNPNILNVAALTVVSD
jgi:hypothetical protein